MSKMPIRRMFNAAAKQKMIAPHTVNSTASLRLLIAGRAYHERATGGFYWSQVSFVVRSAAMNVLRSLLTVGRWIAVIFCSSILLHVIFPTDNPMPFNPRVVLIYSVILAFPYGFIWKTIKRSFQGPPINPIGPLC